MTSFVANTETRKRKLKALTQRDEDAKRSKTTEARRQDRQDAIDKEIVEHRRQLDNLINNTIKISMAVKEGNLDKVIDKAKELNKNVKAKTAKIGKISPLDEAAKSIKEKGRPYLAKEEEEVVESYEGIHGLTPKKTNEKNIPCFDIFHEAKDDSEKVLEYGIISLKSNSITRMDFERHIEVQYVSQG